MRFGCLGVSVARGEGEPYPVAGAYRPWRLKKALGADSCFGFPTPKRRYCFLPGRFFPGKRFCQARIDAVTNQVNHPTNNVYLFAFVGVKSPVFPGNRLSTGGVLHGCPVRAGLRLLLDGPDPAWWSLTGGGQRVAGRPVRLKGLQAVIPWFVEVRTRQLGIVLCMCFGFSCFCWFCSLLLGCHKLLFATMARF